MSSYDDRLRWLLEFSGLDLGKLTPEQWRELDRGVTRFASEWWARDDGFRARAPRPAAVSRSGSGSIASLRRALIGTLQADVQHALAALAGGKSWQVTALPRRQYLAPSRRQPMVCRRTRVAKPPVVARYRGDTRAVFIAGVRDLLVSAWEEIRRCRRPECWTLFLPRRGQEKYCTLSCSKRNRWARYRRSHPERKRNHRLEYQRRKRAQAARGSAAGHRRDADQKRGRRGRRARGH